MAKTFKEFDEKSGVELVEWCGYGRKEDWRNCQQCVIRQQGIDDSTLDEILKDSIGMENKILRLTKFWYEYVGQDHHKDRDCHFYINETWSYGELPKYNVEHYGYIAHDIEPITCETHEEAQKELLKILWGIINNEKEWAERALANPKEWDEVQIKKAHMITSFLSGN